MGIHLAIIPDGNRRWAKKHKKSIKEGYRAGIQKLKRLVEWCKDLNISTLSVWILSTENMKRSKMEIDVLFDLFDKMLDELLYGDEFKKARDEVRIKFVGNITNFPAHLKEKILKIENLTQKNAKYTLAIFCNYGGRKEIVDTVNKIILEAKSGKIKEVNEQLFAKYLYAPEIGEPDLIFRSGGEKRLSGFLPWQSVYSEFYFTNKLWPDVSKKDIYTAIEEFKKRERRFGR
ncbi:MAG: polyprenyl diphosphate synthase [Candidatus Micrarchaeota archaeon]|nr:polyprenyl diphosphate synthase [Candidatus Micrarchaeota archaeon]